MSDRAFQDCLSGGQLPASQPFIYQEFESRPQKYGPQNGQTELAARHRPGRQIAGADAGRGYEYPRAKNRDDRPGSDCRESLGHIFLLSLD